MLRNANRIVWVLVVGCFLVAALSAKAEEKILRIAHTNGLESLDPAMSIDHRTAMFLRAVYDSLVDYVPGKWPELENKLAETYEISPDQLVYTFHLRHGMQWQKGFGEITSEDVKFTLDRAMDPKTGSPTRTLWDPVGKIETPDKYTVKITLKTTDPGFLYKLAPWKSGIIVSKKAFEKFGADYGQRPEAVVGSGPFEVTAFTVGQKYEFRRFDKYHGRKAELDGFEILAIPREATAVLALQKGEVDMLHIRAKESLAALKKDPNITLYMGLSGVPKAFITLNTENQYFKDIRVRRAMAYALDSDLITEYVGGEMATRACGLLAPGVYEAALGCDVLPKYPYDPQKAKALLAEAGYPNGFKSKLTILAVVPYVDIAPVLQDYWRKVGIDMEIEAAPITDYLKKMNDGASVAAMIWSVPAGPPEGSFFLWTALDAASTKPGINTMLYKGVDDLLDKAFASKSPTERKELYGQIQRKVVEDLPIIPVYFERAVLAVRKDVDLGASAKGQTLEPSLWPWVNIEQFDKR